MSRTTIRPPAQRRFAGGPMVVLCRMLTGYQNPPTCFLVINVKSGPEVIKEISYSTQLSTKFHLLIKTRIPTHEEVSCLKSLRCCNYTMPINVNIYEPDKCFAQLS